MLIQAGADSAEVASGNCEDGPEPFQLQPQLLLPLQLQLLTLCSSTLGLVALSLRPPIWALMPPKSTLPESD